MPKKYFAVDALAGIALLAGSALAGASDQSGHVSPRPGTNTNAISTAKDMTAKAVGMISAEMTHSSKAFVEAASISDMYEIEAANIALQRSATRRSRSSPTRCSAITARAV
jgi:putative membrane protein